MKTYYGPEAVLLRNEYRRYLSYQSRWGSYPVPLAEFNLAGWLHSSAAQELRAEEMDQLAPCTRPIGEEQPITATEVKDRQAAWEAAFGRKISEILGRLPDAAEARKAAPMTTGLLDYFPDALVAVAALSRIGNEQHNPGQPMFWNRAKSGDEADCILRHLADRGTTDTDGVRHSTKVAWRALALLQKELEEARGLPISRGSRAS